MKRVLEPEDAHRLLEILDGAGGRTVAEAKASELVEEGLAKVAGTGETVLLRELGVWALAAGR